MAFEKRRQGYCYDKSTKEADAGEANVALAGDDGEEVKALKDGECEMSDPLTSRRQVHAKPYFVHARASRKVEDS